MVSASKATNPGGVFRSGYVAIVGRPNVGKSTLLNNLLHFKVSAVTPKPQTTRHQIRGILNGEDYQIIFLDTPGLLEPHYLLQEAMVQSARRSLQDADVVLFMVEASAQPNPGDVKILQDVLTTAQPILLAINKIDTVNKDALLPLMDSYNKYDKLKGMIPISALKADGLDALTAEIVKHLPESPPFYPTDQLTDHPERFIVSEIIREKVFQKYGEEIPYATTASVEEFKEREDGKDFIRATIYVEKESQKGILIGKKGTALKEVGRLAREEIEFLLDRPVFLELWVKVRDKWRRDEKSLREFGYY